MKFVEPIRVRKKITQIKYLLRGQNRYRVLLLFVVGINTALRISALLKFRLNLWATANVFLPDHRIRLEVSSSNFLRFDRNSNTDGGIANETRDQYQPAVNRIFHDVAHPSHLILPMIER